MHSVSPFPGGLTELTFNTLLCYYTCCLASHSCGFQETSHTCELELLAELLLKCSPNCPVTSVPQAYIIHRAIQQGQPSVILHISPQSAVSWCFKAVYWVVWLWLTSLCICSACFHVVLSLVCLKTTANKKHLCE